MHKSPINRDNPRAQYERRLKARQAALERVTRSDTRLANARAAVFLGGLALAIWLLRSEVVSPGWAITPVIPFLVLVFLHRRCKALQQRLARAVAHYRCGLRRLDERWHGEGESGTRYASRDHLYAEDLALAEIVESLDGRAENAHFQDELVDGRMEFDYRMRPGVVRKSNALDVMRSLGLDV